MTAPSDSLERRYRRLLRWLPTDYRAAREDEMIGVLLQTARPGQRRPDPADAADLIYAVARVWCQRVWCRLRPRLPAIIAAMALLLPLGVALLPGAAGPPADPGQPASLPARFARYSTATGSVSDAPPGRAIALYQHGSEPAQDIVLSADRAAYRQLDLAYAHRAGDDAFDTPAPALLSPDGTRVAVGYFQAKSASLSIQDLATGQVTTHAVPAPSHDWGAGTIPLAWSARGAQVAFLTTTGYNPSASPRSVGDLGILEPGTGRVRTVLRNANVAAVAFAPDGAELAVQDPTRTSLRVIGLDGTTRRLLELPAGMGLPGPAAWSPDGRLIAVAAARVGCPDLHDVSGTSGWCAAGQTRFLDATAQRRPVPPPLSATSRHQLVGWSAADRVLLVGEQDNAGVALVEVGLSGGVRQVSTIPDGGGDTPVGAVQLATGLLGDLHVREPLTPDRGRWPLLWRIGAAIMVTAGIWTALGLLRRLRVQVTAPPAASDAEGSAG